nr:putative ribonuclease H-like domain-containing protein [Tanacetum cinerariifolium]
MKSFVCPITILNTLDHLEKFDGKADKGFFVRYSMNSKAFRVFNSRKKIVEENLHIRFSENTPNVVGSRLDWLYDIDALTRTMNYKPIAAGTQYNDFAGTKACDNAGQARKDKEPVKDYILLPLWTTDPPFSQDPKSSQDDGFQPSSDSGKKVDEDQSKVSECRDQKQDDNVNSINKFNAASTNGINAPLEDISTFNFSSDQKDDDEEADMNNMDITIQVSPVPTTRIYKDHPLDQEELIQFKLQEVWTIVDLPNGKMAIGTKWVFKNKKDERGIVIRNKARLVALGHTQEEEIDYVEVFSPLARIEAIRLFLAYASFKEFAVYHMDVKSAFLYEKIEEGVYVCQTPGFEDPDFSDKLYKIKKTLYGLHQAPRAWYKTLSTYLLDNGFHRGKIDKTLFIRRYKGDILLVQVYVDDIIFGSNKKKLCISFENMMHEMFQMSSIGELTFFLGLQMKQKQDGMSISQDKYVAEILKKYRFTEVKNESTPMETQKPLLKDKDGEKVDVHMYRSMIGSLMYFISSRPDIMFVVCACARYQVNLKVLHLYAMKRIFRPDIMFAVCACAIYHVNPKVSHLRVVKRIFKYLKGQPKLGIWYPKDSLFDLVAYTDSDYAGASLDRKSTSGGFEQIVNFLNANPIHYALTVNPTFYTSCIEQFWGTVKIKTVTEEVQLQALVDGKKVIITESTVRKDLQLEDAEGVDCLPNAAIFEQLTLMGDHIEHVADEAANEELDGSLVRVAKTASSLEAEQDSGVNTPQSDEDSLKLKELIKLCTNLQNRVESSDDDKDLGEDAFKQGMISDIDADEGITLVSTHDDAEMFDADQDLNVTTAATTPTILINEVTLAQALAELKHTKPKAKAKGIVFHEPEESTIIATIPKSKSQDNGKGIMVEEPVKLKKKDQIQLDKEFALKLHAELQAEFDKKQKLAGERA